MENERSYRLGLLGYPLGHSFSPAIHARALSTAGLSGDYRLYPVPPLPAGRQRLQLLLDCLRCGELHGLNVTIPHKQAVLPLLDRLEPAARRIGAVNLLYCRDRQLVGDNTDAAGFRLDLLRFMTANALQRGHALVLGAGGAARAVAVALLEDGWQVTIAARRPEQALGLVQYLLPDKIEFIPLAAGCLAGLTGIALIVNATPAGMAPDDAGNPWPAGVALPAGSAVYDLVYNPVETRLLHTARAARLPASGGLGMLVEQAALSFERWTGRQAPRPAMRQAAGLA